MSARDASIDAYHEAVVDEHGQLGQMERWFRDHGPGTRAMAGAALDFPANVYSARANKLIKEGRLVELEHKAPCHVTGVTVGWLAHVDTLTREQLGLQACALCERDSGIYEMRSYCCAGRFIVNSAGDVDLGIKVACEKHGFEPRKLRMVVAATLHWRRERIMNQMLAERAANEAAG